MTCLNVFLENYVNLHTASKVSIHLPFNGHTDNTCEQKENKQNIAFDCFLGDTLFLEGPTQMSIRDWRLRLSEAGA